jgi:hypothetical protein
MARWHRLLGMAGVFVFLATGLYLAASFPQLHGGDPAVRYQFRANHAYILLASLLNWQIGIHLRPADGARWQLGALRLGSALLLAAPIVLLAAFLLEPPRGVPQRPLTTLGMVLSLGGTVLHAFGRWRRSS